MAPCPSLGVDAGDDADKAETRETAVDGSDNADKVPTAAGRRVVLRRAALPAGGGCRDSRHAGGAFRLLLAARSPDHDP